MALRDEEEGSTDEKVRRGVGRALVNGSLALASLGVIGAWVVTSGWYSLEPGEAAVVLRLGTFQRTVSDEGIHLKLPTPLETETIVNVGEIRRMEFGGSRSDAAPAKEGEAPSRVAENAIQTADSNIVNVSYVLQYAVDDAFSFVFGMVEPRKILHDATQASVREVVGKMTVNDVLYSNRGKVEADSRATLRGLLKTYFGKEGEKSAFAVEAIQLQDVHAPGPVQAAFDDVVAARQDAERATSEAQGSAKEIAERANAEATELRQGALAYKDAVVVEAKGEVSHFLALLEQYRRAPEVTRQRLYLETMEAILPNADKVILEGGSAQVAPVMPLPIPMPQPAAPKAPADAQDTGTPAAAPGAAPAASSAPAPAATSPGEVNS